LRYERKYRIEAVSPSIIVQALRLHPAGLRPLHHARQVNSVYFDTPGFSTYKDNVDGIAERKKYRMRWYGTELLCAEAPKLEIKSRNKEVGEKQSFELPAFSFLHIHKTTKEVNSYCPESGKSLHPVLFNSYQRLYFASPDARFRLTLDWNLQYSPLLSNHIVHKHLYTESNVCILELKYDAKYDNVADRITQYLPYRRTKNSKYVTGIELCYW